MNMEIVQRAKVFLAQVFLLLHDGFLRRGRGYCYELAGRQPAAQQMGNLRSGSAILNGRATQRAKQAVSPYLMPGPIRLNPTESHLIRLNPDESG